MAGSIFWDKCRLEASGEATAMVDRELMEAIYVLLRANQLAQENVQFAVSNSPAQVEGQQQGRSK